MVARAAGATARSGHPRRDGCEVDHHYGGKLNKRSQRTAAPEAIQRRTRLRRQPHPDREAPRVEAVWRLFESASDLPGCRIDCADMPVYAVADRLQELTTHGESLVYTP